MMVLDFIRGKHGHKVSFTETSLEQGQTVPHAEQHAASSSDTAVEGTTAAAAAAGPPLQCNGSSSNLQQQAQQQPQQLQPQQQGGDSHNFKKELRKLLRRAAVSFRDLNISVHDASATSLVHIHDTATGAAAPHTHTGASVLTAGRQRVEVEQKKLAIIMVRGQQTAAETP